MEIEAFGHVRESNRGENCMCHYMDVIRENSNKVHHQLCLVVLPLLACLFGFVKNANCPDRTVIQPPQI